MRVRRHTKAAAGNVGAAPAAGGAGGTEQVWGILVKVGAQARGVEGREERVRVD